MYSMKKCAIPNRAITVLPGSMKITSISQPIVEFPFLNAGKRVGDFYVDRLPVHIATVEHLPDGLDAIIATADLQGRERFQEANGHPIRLLGEVLPQKLIDEVIPKLQMPTGRIGVVLAGDFYTVPALNKRGGTGDVSEVWQSFARQYDWIVGVAGNHDTFGDQPSPTYSPTNASFLDTQTAVHDTIRFGGVSGIIGNPNRHWRSTVEQYCEKIEQVVSEKTDVLVLHDGPDAPDSGGKGNVMVRELLELLPPTLVIRGHAHWKSPLAELDNGTQVLNVDARCVLLVRETAAVN